MKKFILLSALTACVLFIAGCKGNSSLTESTAVEVIASYLKSNPGYETVRIDLGELKFRSRNEKEDLLKYKALEEKGLIKMALKDQKKRFLSKDSTFVYSITLTDQAKLYTLKQDRNQATVKALDYLLDDEKPVTLIKGNDKNARVTVTLKKSLNDFAIFLNDKDKNGSFITKTYKLQNKKDQGWIVTGD